MTYKALRVNINIKNFLDWRNENERFFEYMEIPEEKKMGLVAYKLTEGTLLGWNKHRSQGHGKGRRECDLGRI
jgi:hypothetical protein